MLVIAALWVGNGGSKSNVKRSPAIESHAWDNQLSNTRPKCDCGCGWKELLEAKKDTKAKNFVVHLNCDDCSLGDESEKWFCKDGQTEIDFSGSVWPVSEVTETPEVEEETTINIDDIPDFIFDDTIDWNQQRPSQRDEQKSNKEGDQDSIPIPYNVLAHGFR